jgi:predicted dehydrogenase
VNYIRISDPGAIKIRTKISNGEWGDTFRGSVYYSKGLKNNGSHFFNLLESWLGKFKTHTLIRKGRVWNDEDPEPFFLAAFENGEVVFIPVWEEVFSHYSIELLSPAGRLFYSDGGNNITWQPLVEDSHFKGYRKLSSEAEYIGNDLQRYQLNVADQLAMALNGQPAHICTGEQALLTLKNIDTITNF